MTSRSHRGYRFWCTLSRTVWFNQNTGLLVPEEDHAWLGTRWEGLLSESVIEATGVKVQKRPRSKRCRARAL